MDYSINEIRQAFWNTFYARGEFWFGSLGFAQNVNERDRAMKDAEENTQCYWNEFVENLQQERI